MAATKTFIPATPASWRSFWLEHCYPREEAALQQEEGSILDPLPAATTEAKRIKTYGHVWRWWRLPDDVKEHFRALG